MSRVDGVLILNHVLDVVESCSRERNERNNVSDGFSHKPLYQEYQSFFENSKTSEDWFAPKDEWVCGCDQDERYWQLTENLRVSILKDVKELVEDVDRCKSFELNPKSDDAVRVEFGMLVIKTNTVLRQLKQVAAQLRDSDRFRDANKLHMAPLLCSLFSHIPTNSSDVDVAPLLKKLWVGCYIK